MTFLRRLLGRRARLSQWFPGDLPPAGHDLRSDIVRVGVNNRHATYPNGWGGGTTTGRWSS